MPEPLVAHDQTYATITDKISGDVIGKKTPRGMMITLAVTSLLIVVFVISVTYLLYKGIGIWGENIPVGWAFDITNFVWWIGIGHAGTLISAILLLLHQHWRNA